MKRFETEGVARKVTPKSALASAFLLILSTLTLATSASAAELVVNGGFESPVVPTFPDTDKGWATYYGENYPYEPGDALFEPCDPLHPEFDMCNDDTLVPGWSVFWTDDLMTSQQLNPGRLEIQTGDTSGTEALERAQKAELDSHHRVGNDNTNVTISQILPTCPLTAYKLSYGWKSRTEIAGDNDVRVYVNDNEVAMHKQNEDWKIEEHDFISDNSDETLLLFGSIGTETTQGMFLDMVSVTGPDGSLEDPCLPPERLICKNKPKEIVLRYNGTYTSNHQQSGNEVIISPDSGPSFPTDAIIEVYGHNKKRPDFRGSFKVKKGRFFSVSGPHKRIPPRLTFKIYDPNKLATPLQTVTFHTSCSQPLDAGDEFGAITAWSANN